MQYILCGYMGSGKSHIGKILAERWQVPFYDLDRQIEVQENRSIAELFQKKGEIYFRKKETEALKTLLKQAQKSIISLGGGTPCYGNNLEIIKENNSRLIYLKMGLENLTSRLWKEKEKRPLISEIKTREKLEDFIRKHLFERQFYYLQSHQTVDLDECRNEREIIDKIGAQ